MNRCFGKLCIPTLGDIHLCSLERDDPTCKVENVPQLYKCTDYTES